LGLATFIVGSLGVACGEKSVGAERTGSLRVQELVLVNTDGAEVASFGVNKLGRPMLLMKGGEGKEGLGLVMDTESGPAVELYDRNGLRRTLLAATPNGAALQMFDEAGKARIELAQTGAGEALTLKDRAGAVRAR